MCCVLSVGLSPSLCEPGFPRDSVRDEPVMGVKVYDRNRNAVINGESASASHMTAPIHCSAVTTVTQWEPRRRHQEATSASPDVRQPSSGVCARVGVPVRACCVPAPPGHVSREDGALVLARGVGWAG